MAEMNSDERADIRASAIKAAVGKLAETVAEFHAAKQQQEHAKALLDGADARITAALERHTQLVTMAQLFEFDLDQEYTAWFERQAQLPNPAPDSSPNRPTTAMNAAITVADKQKMTIKDQVISAARQAHPAPVRASALRRQFEAAGLIVHEKTIGMTLYRLSREGALRREGWNWFFVPESERIAAAQDEESPGDEPGLLFHAAE